MPVQFTLRCRCGRKVDLAFDEWEAAKDMVLRARCSACGASGIPALSLERVHFLSEGESARQRIERLKGGR